MPRDVKIVREVITIKEAEWYARIIEESRNADWHTEELLIQNNLLEEVKNFKDPFSCPLCKKPFESGDKVIPRLGLPFHVGCLGKLKRRKP